MKVFISWSGRRSHEVAETLGSWLKKVIQSADPWISSDMERGVKWLAEIGKSLDTHSLGILCVTPGNKDAPWINFEAGALSKHLGDEFRVIPYLLDFKSPSDLKEPLGQFNASLADRDGTWALVKTLNTHAEYPQTEADLTETFEVWWPKLEESLERIRASVTRQPSNRRTTEDKVDEVLELTRQIMRTGMAAPGPIPSWRDLNRIADAIIAVRSAGPHAQIELSGGIATTNYDRLVGAALQGEGTLSAVGVPGPARAATPKVEVANVVEMMLIKQGLDRSAMNVVNADPDEVLIYVPHSIHNSVLKRVRRAIKLTTPAAGPVKFFTIGNNQEMETVDPDSTGGSGT